MSPTVPFAQPLIGFGQIRHARLRPARNAFAYPTWFLMLPMRSLRQHGSGALAHNRRALLSFFDSDHGDGSDNALAWIDALLLREGVKDAGGEIWLHTYPRVLGYAFKPVSFWYCHRADGTLRAIVVEVNNTFGERHCHLLDAPRYGQELKADKVFHVSPFCTLAGGYRFRFMRSGPHGLEKTVARIDYDDNAPRAARTALKLLARLRHGTLTVQLPDGSLQRFGTASGPAASLHLHNWNACGAALRSGDIGFAESYIAGDWSTPHLCDLLQVFLVNRKEVQDVIHGNWLGRLAYRVKHWLNRNTKANSARNIHAHYDLGNAFYALWLDGTMNYSSAIFESPQSTLKEGQEAKVRRALSMARVRPGDRVLEIGCGWGALAEMAATQFKACVVGARRLRRGQLRMPATGAGTGVSARV